jgi:hypothetical protein
MPNHLPRGLPNGYVETNGHSTEAAYRDGHSGPPRPYQTPNKEMPESAYAKRFAESRSALQWR